MAMPTGEPDPRPLAIRQDVQVITQTLAYEHTTFATHVTLGEQTMGGQATSALSIPSATQVTVHQGSQGGLSDAQVGAIAGSVVGVFILGFIIFCCCWQGRRPPPARHGYRRSHAGYSGSYIVDDAYGRPSSKEHWPRSPSTSWPRPPSTHRPRTPSSYRRSPLQRPSSVPWPAPAAERIPGGPKFPTYRAIPIPNPRRAVHVP
ncbi:hypothetical protein BGZ63DRAFT_399891 [Mariannaea sp. PMI_226]|nr:hypothetical protein BGZ63DRAFT_399891 [Mariannaea sp. PMI_226]